MAAKRFQSHVYFATYFSWLIFLSAAPDRDPRYKLRRFLPFFPLPNHTKYYLTAKSKIMAIFPIHVWEGRRLPSPHPPTCFSCPLGTCDGKQACKGRRCNSITPENIREGSQKKNRKNCGILSNHFLNGAKRSIRFDHWRFIFQQKMGEGVNSAAVWN